MTPDHPVFADWDAAYVVGALSAADRRLYEGHLDECPQCREALAELAPTLGLLARVSPDRAEALLDGTPSEGDSGRGPDPTARARLVAVGARELRRRRIVVWGGALAAAAVIAVVVGFGITAAVAPAVRPAETIALQPVTAVPLTASVRLTDVAWGTRIDMTCSYGDSDDPYASAEEWPYVLVVTSTDGTSSELSSWRAGPGSTSRLQAGTALDPDEIATIEVRAVADGKVLARGEP
ncbi:zf-HC2 domain-containing protein [Microbacterium sp. NEAU-LLC]|uniref:Zf-HC2 domain-containing protein n=1 Tax=Microbacterium helvum TaxID=2773713 RepID=A0ABR8NPI2_9MICO|nr:zf-HC2 domain-containing protein [Microbacterium helvum]MBD3942353.1 zf-HC2 domain-containing protein [Microbacterium helvum]